MHTDADADTSPCGYLVRSPDGGSGGGDWVCSRAPLHRFSDAQLRQRALPPGCPGDGSVLGLIEYCDALG